MFRTPLFESHKKLGAKIVDFAGWDMPIQYTNVLDEHTTTRTKVGIFDISHMGEIFVHGPDAKRFLQHVQTNDIELLKDKKAFYSCICNPQGGVIDDIFVYRFSEHLFMLVVNASNIEKDFTHLLNNKQSLDVEIENNSNKYSKIDLQGPLSQDTLQPITNFNLALLNRFSFTECKISDKNVILSRTGYTGEDGFEIYSSNEDSTIIWDALLESGKGFGIKPIGLGARDTLRIEASYSLYGHELNEQRTAIESGIGFIVKPKLVDFIGKNILLKQKAIPPPTNIMCFEMIDKSIPREGYDVIKERKIGTVTSGTFSPTFRKGIGLAFINIRLEIGTIINIDIRGKAYRAEVVKRPFYVYGGKNEKS